MSLFIFVVLIIFRLGWTLWQKWTTLANWPLNAVRTTSPWTAASLLTNWVTTAPLTIQKVEGHAPFIPSWSKTFQNCFRVWISSTSRPLDKTKYHLHLQKSLLPPPRNLKRQSVTPPKKKEHQIQQCREIAGLAFPNALFKVALRVTSLLHSLCLKSPCTWRVMGTQGALGLRLSSTRLIWAEAHPPFWIHRIARSSGWSWNQSIQAMGVSPMRVSMPWMGGTCRWVSRDHRKSLWRDAHQRPCRSTWQTSRLCTPKPSRLTVTLPALHHLQGRTSQTLTSGKCHPAQTIKLPPQVLSGSWTRMRCASPTHQGAPKSTGMARMSSSLFPPSWKRLRCWQWSWKASLRLYRKEACKSPSRTWMIGSSLRSTLIGRAAMISFCFTPIRSPPEPDAFHLPPRVTWHLLWMTASSLAHSAICCLRMREREVHLSPGVEIYQLAGPVHQRWCFNAHPWYSNY